VDTFKQFRETAEDPTEVGEALSVKYLENKRDYNIAIRNIIVRHRATSEHLEEVIVELREILQNGLASYILKEVLDRVDDEEHQKVVFNFIEKNPDTVVKALKNHFGGTEEKELMKGFKEVVEDIGPDIAEDVVDDIVDSADLAQYAKDWPRFHSAGKSMKSFFKGLF